MKAYGDRGGTAPLSFLTSALEEDKWPAPAALPPNKEPLLPIQRGPEAGAEASEKRNMCLLCRDSSQDSSGVQPVAQCIPPKLHRTRGG